MKAMMEVWWDDWDVPASCEVQMQVEVRFGIDENFGVWMKAKVNARSSRSCRYSHGGDVNQYLLTFSQ